MPEDAMARLTIFEQSEREDITTIMTDEWKKWHGEEETNRRRIALRIEKELICDTSRCV